MKRRYVKNEWGATIDYEVAENITDEETGKEYDAEIDLLTWSFRLLEL